MKALSKLVVCSILFVTAQVVHADDVSERAGNDGMSGGTYALCNKTMEKYHVKDLTKIPGFLGYRSMIGLLVAKLPVLAQELAKVETFNWYYFQLSQNCKFEPITQQNKHAPHTALFRLNQPVEMVPITRHIYIRGDAFDKLIDPESSIIHEAARSICSQHQHYSPALLIDRYDEVTSVALRLAQTKQNGCTQDLSLILQSINSNTTAKEILEKLQSMPNPIYPYYIGSALSDYQEALRQIYSLQGKYNELFSEYDRIIQIWTDHFSDQNNAGHVSTEIYGHYPRIASRRAESVRYYRNGVRKKCLRLSSSAANSVSDHNRQIIDNKDGTVTISHKELHKQCVLENIPSDFFGKRKAVYLGHSSIPTTALVREYGSSVFELTYYSHNSNLHSRLHTNFVSENDSDRYRSMIIESLSEVQQWAIEDVLDRLR